MDRIYRVWEIELQAVLEINKIGHRKRILYSVSDRQMHPLNGGDSADKTNELTSAVIYFFFNYILFVLL